MASNLKKFKPMSCPVCDGFYFTEFTEEELKSETNPNEQQCSRCGWLYDLEQVENPDLQNKTNVMSLNQYKSWYKNKIKVNSKWEYYMDYVGEPEPHKCPVCNEYEFKDLLCHDICPICGWEDNGMEIDPYDKSGGPSKEFSDYKKWFFEQRSINPKFKFIPRKTKTPK